MLHTEKDKIDIRETLKNMQKIKRELKGRRFDRFKRNNVQAAEKSFEIIDRESKKIQRLAIELWP